MGKCAVGKEKKKLKWWQLSLIGVGCTIGTGFFLGSGLGIKLAGPAILLSFIVAAIATFIVYDALAAMSIDDPQKGSFRTYAKKAFGKPMGFMNGWMYWFSEMLIMGSQLTALSLFSRFWFPDIPMWVFASIFAVLGLLVIIIGTQLFEKIENISAIVKIAAILMFVIIAILGVTGVIGGKDSFDLPSSMKEFFPTDWKNIWSSLIFAFFAFGGIEVMGIMSMRLENKEDAPKAGRWMIICLTVIYLASLFFVVSILQWDQVNTDKSPFLSVMNLYNIKLVPHLFNSALIIAGFSTMTASLFAITTMLVTLSEDKDAPKFLSKKGRFAIPVPAFLVTAAGLALSIFLSLVMPDKVYEYFTTGAGLLILYNWLLILATYSKLIELKFWDKLKRNIGILFILLAITGTLFAKGTRGGFFVSIGFLTFVGLVTVFISMKRKIKEKKIKQFNANRKKKSHGKRKKKKRPKKK